MTPDADVAGLPLPDPFQLRVLESAGSTNDELRELALQGAPDGLVLLALRQTAGRGRRGADWFSSPETSLAFSILVRPPEPRSLWPRLALTAGLAVAEAIESFGISAGIKWPNDVWINRRKVAGILVDAAADFAIVGIGLNVNTTDFPAEVAHLATSLFLESREEISRGEVLRRVLNRFGHRRQAIGSGFDDILDAIRCRCVLTGHEVTLTTAAGIRAGRVEGIANDATLLLRGPDGIERLLQADEIRLV